MILLTFACPSQYPLAPTMSTMSLPLPHFYFSWNEMNWLLPPPQPSLLLTINPLLWLFCSGHLDILFCLLSSNTSNLVCLLSVPVWGDRGSPVVVSTVKLELMAWLIQQIYTQCKSVNKEVRLRSICVWCGFQIYPSVWKTEQDKYNWLSVYTIQVKTLLMPYMLLTIKPSGEKSITGNYQYFMWCVQLHAYQSHDELSSTK